MSANPYVTIDATLERTIEETPNIKTLRIRPAEPIEFAAGQFVDLLVPGFGEALAKDVMDYLARQKPEQPAELD